MRYPVFIKEKSTIGICAPSAGVGHKLASFDESIKVLKANGFRIKESKSVRNNNQRSTSAKNRGKELNELIIDDSIDMVMTATGGDYMFEVMPYIDFDGIDKHPKWLMGFSDPTNLLYVVTTKLDIATLYGFNGCSYSLDNPSWQKKNLEILKGNIVKQNSYSKYQTFIDNCNDINNFNHKVKWLCNKPELNISGRLIGGCFEVIEKIIGTKYDYTKEFIERYKDDGIVWFFDIFSDSAYAFYLTLLQMKYAGYFKYCKAVLFGRVAFPKIDDDKFDYEKAAKLALGRTPYIMEMDIGHTDPKMTLINGSIINVKYKDNKGSIQFKLK